MFSETVMVTPIATPHAHAVVDLEALAHNTSLLAGGTTAAVMAVVRADGFGHGAVPVATTALASGATWLGVTTCAEAVHLRQSGITAPILSLTHHPGEDVGPALLADVDVSVSSSDHLRAVAASASRLGITANVHLKADTGGARPDEWRELVLLGRDLPYVYVRGIWSHLISGTDPAAVRAQVRLFDEATAVAREAGLRPDLRHLANSVATLTAPETHFDLVRPGIGLYGVEPDPERTFGLRGAMTLVARIVLVTRRDSTLAVVPLGYADGLPSAAAPDAEVLIAGRRCPVAGRIAMDQFVVDLGDDTARTGDQVVVFGPGTEGEPTVAEWARWAGTVPHEIVTGVGPRVTRRYPRALRR